MRNIGIWLDQKEANIITLADDKKERFIEIETNGTIYPSTDLVYQVDRFIVSPKLSNADQKTAFQYIFVVLRKTFFKFVVDKPSDLNEILQFVNDNGIEHRIVYLMPQSTTVKEQLSKLSFIIEFAKKHDFKVTPRLQILVYGNRRGV